MQTFRPDQTNRLEINRVLTLSVQKEQEQNAASLGKQIHTDERCLGQAFEARWVNRKICLDARWQRHSYANEKYFATSFHSVRKNVTHLVKKNQSPASIDKFTWLNEALCVCILKARTGNWLFCRFRNIILTISGPISKQNILLLGRRRYHRYFFGILRKNKHMDTCLQVPVPFYDPSLFLSKAE